MFNEKNDFNLMSNHNILDVSRRGMIKTLGLGLSFTTLPSFMSSAMTEVPIDVLDRGERIIPVKENELIEMQKFIEDCIVANKDSNPQEAVKEVLEKGVSDPAAMLKAIGEPIEAGLKVFLRSKDLTIYAAAWTSNEPIASQPSYVGEYWNLYWTGRQYIMGTT